MEEKYSSYITDRFRSNYSVSYNIIFIVEINIFLLRNFCFSNIYEFEIIFSSIVYMYIFYGC